MAAHALKGKLSTEHLQVFETAARYQMYHSLALLATGILYDQLNQRLSRLAAYGFITGMLCFSGSLYFLSTTELTGFSNLRWLGPVTPLGGLFFITGWILLGLSAYKTKK